MLTTRAVVYGAQVAGCICLFSLDKHQAIPVDTHVWQFACRYYTPELTGKSVTPKIMAVVENAIIGVFGDYAGWAHNILFIAEVRERKGAPDRSFRRQGNVAEGPLHAGL